MVIRLTATQLNTAHNIPAAQEGKIKPIAPSKDIIRFKPKIFFLNIKKQKFDKYYVFKGLPYLLFHKKK